MLLLITLRVINRFFCFLAVFAAMWVNRHIEKYYGDKKFTVKEEDWTLFKV